MIRALDTKDIPFIVSARNIDFCDGWNGAMLESAFASGRFFGFVAEDSGKAVAFAAADMAADTADLVFIYTFPEYRKKGLGTSLVRAVCDAARGRGAVKLFLEVRKSNLPALALYEKAGFVKAGERAAYYGDGETATVMVKEL